MSSSITTQGEKLMLDAMFGAQAVPANYYIGLSTTQPLEAGTSVTEPTIGVNGYARIAVPNGIGAGSFLAAVGGDPSSKKNDGVLAFPTATGDWASAADFGWVVVFDHATATTAINVIAYVQLTSTRKVLNTETFVIPDQELNFTLD